MIALVSLLASSALAKDPERVDVLFDFAIGVSLYVHDLDPVEFVAKAPSGPGVAIRLGERFRVGGMFHAGLPTGLELQVLTDYVPNGFATSGPLLGVSLGGLAASMNCPYGDDPRCPQPSRTAYAVALGPIAHVRVGWRETIGAERRNGVTVYTQGGVAWMVASDDPDELSGLYAGGLLGAGLTFDL